MLDQQGNFGNLLTGDPAAAARYIETRLSPLRPRDSCSIQTSPEWSPSYDSRALRPVTLPAKIPLVLIARESMESPSACPHASSHTNCVELLEAQIAILQGRGILHPPRLLHRRHHGCHRLRQRPRKSETARENRITRSPKLSSSPKSATEPPQNPSSAPSTKPPKRGKIKIESINDYTADKVEIEIKLPRGQYAPRPDRPHSYASHGMRSNAPFPTHGDSR